jgi:hypothetical protein
MMGRNTAVTIIFFTQPFLLFPARKDVRIPYNIFAALKLRFDAIIQKIGDEKLEKKTGKKTAGFAADTDYAVQPAAGRGAG